MKDRRSSIILITKGTIPIIELRYKCATVGSKKVAYLYPKKVNESRNMVYVIVKEHDEVTDLMEYMYEGWIPLESENFEVAYEVK